MRAASEHKPKRKKVTTHPMERRWPWQTMLLWLVAVVLINAIWMNVAGQSAPNEINAEGKFQPHREVNISPVFGSSSAIPATLESTFSSTSVDQANLSIAIKKDNTTVVYSWSGQLSDTVPVWSGELEPGTYTVETIVDEGVLVVQQLELQPFGSIQNAGHVVLTLLLIALAWGEQGVRALLARWKPVQKATQSAEKTPFKASKLSHEDEQLGWNENDSPWREPLR